MSKSYDELTVEIEISFEPEDYNNYEDLISAVQDEYGTVVQYLQLTIDEADERFIENSS